MDQKLEVIKKMEESLDSAEQENSRAEEKMGKLESECEKLKQDERKTRSELEKVMLERQAWNEEKLHVAVLEDQLSSADAELEKAISEIQAKKKQTLEAMKKMEESLESAEHEKNLAEEKIGKLESKYENLKQNWKEEKLRIAELEDQLRSAVTKDSETAILADFRLKDLEKQVQEAEVRELESRDELKAVEARAAEMAESLGMSKADLKKLSDGIGILQSKLEGAVKETADAVRELGQTQAAKDQLEAEAEITLRTERIAFNEKCGRLEGQIRALRAEKEHRTSHLERELEESRLEAEKERVSVEKMLSEAQEATLRAAEELRKEKEVYREKEREYRRVNAEHEELAKQRDALVAEQNTKARQCWDVAQEKIAEAKELEIKLEAAVHELQERKNELTGMHSEKEKADMSLAEAESRIEDLEVVFKSDLPEGQLAAAQERARELEEELGEIFFAENSYSFGFVRRTTRVE